MSNLSDISEKIVNRVRAIEQWNTATLSTRQVVAEEYQPEDFEKLVTALRERPVNGEVVFRLHSFIYEKQETLVPKSLREMAADNLAADLDQIDCLVSEARF